MEASTSVVSPLIAVEEELQCPICKEILTDPVALDCAHTFCKSCIAQYCEKWEDLGDLECPLCKAKIKKKNFRPNWQLANTVEKIKTLSSKIGLMCGRHIATFNLFCKEDKEFVCSICERSPEHQSHTILLLEDAAAEYKEAASVPSSISLTNHFTSPSRVIFRKGNSQLKTEVKVTPVSVCKEVMAAASSPVQALCEEATCPICLDYFTDPVTIAECGHNFCRACLTQYWKEEDVVASCPHCREIILKRNLIPNRQLANFVEIAKKFSLTGGEEAEKRGPLCEKHQEPLKLFCKNEKIPLCVGCDLDHRFHKVVLLEEASQDYKDKICSWLPVLKKQREQVLAYKADMEKEHQDLLNQTEAEKQKMVSKFRQLHQFLEEQEKLLLAQMEEMEKEMVTSRDQYAAKLSEELSSLESLIQEMEEKCQQPANKLLKSIGSITKRYKEKETFENPVDVPLELKWKIWDFSDINSFLEGVTNQFKDTLVSGLPLQKANVTLDPDTAHPQLFLSEDHKSLRLGCRAKILPQNPERFDRFSIVLGCEEFTAGRHFWDVCVSPEEEWAVGVTRKSLGRKGFVVFSPQEGVWALGKWGGGYRATTEQLPPPLPLNGEIKRIRVSLNYAGGLVTFLNADTAAPIFTFLAPSFSGEILQPFFWVYEKAHLSLAC